jgi:hypothetical protein
MGLPDSSGVYFSISFYFLQHLRLLSSGSELHFSFEVSTLYSFMARRMVGDTFLANATLCVVPINAFIVMPRRQATASTKTFYLQRLGRRLRTFLILILGLDSGKERRRRKINLDGYMTYEAF